MRKIFTVAVMCATALSPIVSTQASAATVVLDTVTADAANQDTLAAMQNQCDAFAANHENAEDWSGTPVEGAVSWVSGPIEVGTHSIADAVGNSLTGAGTFTPAHKIIVGDPFRNGGSANMFGVQETVGGHYSASTYDFQGEFSSTYSHAFTCDMTEVVHHHDLVTPASQGTGHHERDDGNLNAQNCHSFDLQGLYFGVNGPGDNTAHCVWIWDSEPQEAVYNDYDTENHSVENGTAVNQDQTDTLLAHETAGEGFDTSETYILGNVVVCISPGPKGGTWKAQSGYTGNKCTTAWFNGGATAGVPNLNDHPHMNLPVV